MTFVESSQFVYINYFVEHQKFGESNHFSPGAEENQHWKMNLFGCRAVFLCKPGHVGSSEVEMRLLAVVFDYEDCDTSATKPTCKITIVNILIFIYGQHFLFPTIFCQQLLGHWISPGCSVGCLLDMQSNCLFQYIWCSLTVETQLAMLTLPLGCIHFTWWNRKMTPDMG